MTLTGAHAWTVSLCNSCIVVMAGRWIMFDNGAWDFKIDNDRMGRAVDTSRIRGAEELKTCIVAAYGLLGKEVLVEMSYWLNDGESEMQIEECYKRNSQSGGMRNVNDKFKGLQQKAMVGRAGDAFRVLEFKEIMELIKLTDWRCWDYLEKIEKKLWTRSHFEGERFNVMTSNAAESLNNALLPARDSPIMALFEFICRKLCTWYVSRRTEISKMKGNVPDNIPKILVEQLVLSKGLLVMPCSTWLFEVTHRPTNFGFTVDLDKRTCTCLEFQKLGLPCRHAIAAASCRNMQYTMFVCKHHLKETWAETVRGIILPVPDPKDVEVPAGILTVDLYPPTTKRTKGRPGIKRKLSAGEIPVRLWC
ncbi:unnamed protein product [Brassica napus]|uniref:(rape) hypothetical protein n=1 Tax=Brassica napus TaxID=3708 RepID=A0A816LQQ7_BRANA|nr:unnamed protein product [Brassica napus]